MFCDRVTSQMYRSGDECSMLVIYLTQVFMHVVIMRSSADSEESVIPITAVFKKVGTAQNRKHFTTRP